MALSLNKVMLIGNLGKAPETRITTNDNAVTNFSIATTHGYKDKSGEWQNQTTWHNCQAWNISDNMLKQLKKGNKVYVEGRINTREYTDKEGVKRYITEVIVEKIIPLTKSENGDENGGINNYQDNPYANSDNPEEPPF